MDYYFESWEGALRFCMKAYQSGGFDLFRGQVRDWPAISPSILRGDENRRLQSSKMLEEFVEWGKYVPQMAMYNGDEEQLTAIAQHYGIPTRYLDLTTDPAIACIFSAATDVESLGGNSIIYCFTRAQVSSMSGFKFHDFDVANLWRLKAQRGVFLEVVDQGAVDGLRGVATRVHFPTKLIDAGETLAVYPSRRSALETTIDQWMYRRMVNSSLDSVSEGLQFQSLIRRKSYPGVARWRVISDFEIEWIGRDPRWVFQKDDRIIKSVVGHQYDIKMPMGCSIFQALTELESRFFEVLNICERSSMDADFRIRMEGFDSESFSASEIINRCWDGIRVFPYSRESKARCLARTCLAIIWALKFPEEVWEDLLWGRAVGIDVAPVGGHLDSAMVSEESLIESLNSDFHSHLTAYALRNVNGNSLYLFDFVVDPWVLFKFERFSRMFVEEFIPSCIGWYFKSCIEAGDGKLSELWGTSFNPALLGFVTLSSYRFRSPISTERDADRIILVYPDMCDEDLEEIFVSCIPSILMGGDPFTVKFTGYDHDEREVWEIDEVVEQCRKILEIGGISVLDVLAEEDPDEERDSGPKKVWQAKGLGALHLWAIGKGCLGKIVGVPFEGIRHILSEFVEDLHRSNEEIDRRARAQSDWREPVLESAGK